MFNETNVQSSMLTSLGYDAGSRQVVATFKSNGDRWRYDGVPPNVYEEVIGAESIGKAFSSLIKGRYTAQKIG